MTTPCTTDGRNAVTPPAALPAPGILEDSNTVHPSLVGTTQRIPMRTIGEHEQDTPHSPKPCKFSKIMSEFVHI